MKKKLRIGFAMGGGVSLGTFNGAALTQTLKLAILRGGYSKVEVDCFSGASAGAMSLAILIRSLVNRTKARSDKARKYLIDNHEEEFKKLSTELQNDLVAAQVAQDIQEELWVSDIKIKDLLSDSVSGNTKIKYTAGLVNRAAVENLSQKWMNFPGEQLNLSNKRILANRVLFACALNNQTPILQDARREFTEEEIFWKSLADGMTSYNHRELRVFDLMFKDPGEANFTDEEVHPDRWYRYRAGTYKKGVVGDLRSRKAWSTIAATSIASGAVPGAFEPVVLTRKKFEFGKLWPASLKNRKEHPFTYSDGGTLNNEPIRECFRMAAFLDAKNGIENVDRWIVFVDPYVTEPDPKLRVPMHRKWALYEPNKLLGNVIGSFDGWDLEQLTSLDRLIPNIITLAKTIGDQSRAIEGDKLFQTKNLFNLRDDFRNILDQSLSKSPTTPYLEALNNYIGKQLHKDKENVLIPAGSLTPKGELKRVIQEESGLNNLKGKEGEFVADINGAKNKDLWLRALAYVAVDLVMNLTGKSPHTKLIAISPGEPLPGGLMGAFGGFTSEIPGEHEINVARYRTQQMLEDARFIEPSNRGNKPTFTKEKKQKYRKDFEKIIPLLTKRIVDVLDDNHVPIIPYIPDILVHAFIKSKLKKFAEQITSEKKHKGIKYEFHIQLPADAKDFELDGKGIADNDIKPVLLNGIMTLITFVSYEPENKTWEGVHLNQQKKAIQVDRNGFFDKKFCNFNLPGSTQMTMATQLPNPIFIAKLKPQDKGKSLAAARWGEADDGVKPLEETLL